MRCIRDILEDWTGYAANELYFRKMANMGAHAARADRISRLLTGRSQ